MFVATIKFSKKTAVFIVVIAALLLIGTVLLAGAHSKASRLEAAGEKLITTVHSEKDMVKYLAQYGWEVNFPALSKETAVIPRQFSDVFTAYNELQKKQGFDLSELCGLEVEVYTYKVNNYPNEENVIAQLFVRNGCVVGGDIHSSELDGFMQGIK